MSSSGSSISSASAAIVALISLQYDKEKKRQHIYFLPKLIFVSVFIAKLLNNTDRFGEWKKARCRTSTKLFSFIIKALENRTLTWEILK